MSDLDTGQVWIPEVAHSMQGAEQIVQEDPRSQCFSYYSTQHIMSLHRHRQHGDQHAVNRHHITVSTSQQPHCSFRALFGRPVGHSDKNNAFFIPRAEAGDYNYDVGSGWIRKERLSNIWKGGCNASQQHSKQGRRT